MYSDIFSQLFFQNETRVLVTEEDVIDDAGENAGENENTIFVDMTAASTDASKPEHEGEEEEGKIVEKTSSGLGGSVLRFLPNTPLPLQNSCTVSAA